MKQTNNAIKFLMAQYRAIFKNANLKMFLAAATAAAAMASTQAQANPITELSGLTTSVKEANTGSEIKITDDGATPNTQAFDITIKGGENAIDGKSKEGAISAAKGSLTIDGAGASLAIGNTIGGTAQGAAVTLKKMTVLNGELKLNDAAGAKNAKLTATDIVIGAAAEEAPKATKTAKVTLGTSGTLAGAISVLNGGTIDAVAASGDLAKSVISGESLTVGKGGKINVATKKGLTISSKTFTVEEGGKLELAAADSKVAFGGTTLILKAGSIAGKKGTIDLGALANSRNVNLSIDAASFNNDLFKAGQVALDGATTNAGTLTINIQDEDPATKIDLVGSGFLKADTGDFGDNFSGGTNAAQATVNLDSNGEGVLAAAAYDPKKFKGSLDFSSLTVGKADTGEFAIKGGTVTVGSNLTVVEKTDKKAQNLTVSGSGVLNLQAAAGASGSVVAKNVTVNATNNNDKALNVTGGTWSVGNLTLTKGIVDIKDATLVLNEGSNLSIATVSDASLSANNGTLDASKAGVLNLGGANAISLENGGRVIFDAEDVYTVGNDGSVTAAAGNGTDKSKFTQNAIKGDGTSFLQINVKEEKVTAELAGKVKEAVAKTGFEGFIDFGDKIEAFDKPSIKYDEMTDGVNRMYGNTQVQMGANNNIDKSVSAGNLKLSGTGADAVANVKKGNTLVLSNANTELGKGMFVQDAKGNVAGVQLESDASALTLNGSGKIGSIVAGADKKGSVTIGGDVNGNGTVTVEGGIGKTGAAVANLIVNKDSTLVVAGTEKTGKDVFTEKLTLNKGSTLKADGQTVTVGGSTDTAIDGNLTAKALTFSTADVGAKIANDAFVDVDELFLVTGTGKGKIVVGTAGENGSSGTLEVGKLTLNGGTLEVDPALGKKAAVSAISTLSKDENGVQVLDGNVVVGENSVVAVGYDTREEIESLLITLGYMDPTTHGFMKDPAAPTDPNAPTSRAGTSPEKTLKATFVVDKPIKIDNGKGITVDSAGSAAENDKVKLGADSALIITDGVYQLVNGKKQGTAITFGKTGGSGEVSADATSKIILAGAFDGADTDIRIFGNAQNVPATLKVESANGVLEGTLNADGSIKDFGVKAGALDGKFASVATPVADLLKARIDGKDPRFDKTQFGATWLLDVAMDAVDTSGVKADAAAHAATYAGAQVAAVASVGTMAEAVGGRVGSMGVEASIIPATGSQANGGVWVSPMYKSVDADGFNAEGASYGADVDLAGVAFGADTVNGNMRFGAVFNIGSGDADGKGNGNGLKDEFDYYGFGMYSAMGFGNFALVGDASLNVISHDVEGLGAKGSADTTAVTMGVTGQYTISNPAVDVTPHLGVRFIRLDTDSYDLTVDGKVLASTDFEVQNVFSIPLGVTLSKAIEMGGWSLAPSADLSITFNTGDTEVQSTTQFTGAYGINLTSEVLDEVTYGVAVGLGAQYGAFGTNIGINYTGSSNTDSFGVNAQARYMF